MFLHIRFRIKGPRRERTNNARFDILHLFVLEVNTSTIALISSGHFPIITSNYLLIILIFSYLFVCPF